MSRVSSDDDSFLLVVYPRRVPMAVCVVHAGTVNFAVDRCVLSTMVSFGVRRHATRLLTKNLLTVIPCVPE